MACNWNQGIWGKEEVGTDFKWQGTDYFNVHNNKTCQQNKE